MFLCCTLQRISGSASPIAAPAAVRELLQWQLPASLPAVAAGPACQRPPASHLPQQQVSKPLPGTQQNDPGAPLSTQRTAHIPQPTLQQQPPSPPAPQRAMAAARPATSLPAANELSELAEAAATAAASDSALGSKAAPPAPTGERHSARRKRSAAGGNLNNGSLLSIAGKAVSLSASGRLQPATPVQPPLSLAPLQLTLSPRRAASAAAGRDAASGTGAAAAAAGDSVAPAAQQPSRSNKHHSAGHQQQAAQASWCRWLFRLSDLCLPASRRMKAVRICNMQ